MTNDHAPLRVLDLSTTLSGLYCSYLLTCAGVSVTRIEPPGGHPLRTWRASQPMDGDDRRGGLFAWLAGGQTSVTADFASQTDVSELVKWSRGVHLIMWEPRAGIPLQTLQTGAPNRLILSITPFGLHGPWEKREATEFTLQAMAGAPALRGSRSWPPISAGGQFGEYMIGTFAAVAALIGLRDLTTAGMCGGTIDLSGLESLIMTQNFNPHTMETQVGGMRPTRPLATVADIVESKDGYVGFAVVASLQHWLDFCAMIGQPQWAEDPSLYPVHARSERHEELNPIIRQWAIERTTAEIVELATLMRIPCIQIGNGKTLVEMTEFMDAGFYAVNPTEGFLQPAPPFRVVPPIPGVAEIHPAPTLGQSIRSVQPPPALEEGPEVPNGSPAPSSRSSARHRPLPFEGLRVADFTSFWAGPLVTHLLGMWGADVVHVESTKRLDGSRLMNHHPATEPMWWERSSCYHSTNTNKRGITLDMDTEEGRAIALRLVEKSDIVVENYSPRVMERWGLGWDVVRSVRPDAVMVRMPAFALDGPLRSRTGFAMTMEQVSGMAWLHGFPENPPASLMGPCDPNAGLHAMVGLLSALEHRRRTGEGSLVESRMVASALNVAGEQVVEYSAYGVRLDRQGNRGPAGAPQNSYQCADWDDDLGQRGWVSLAVSDDQQWQRLKAVLGNSPWADSPELGTHAGRLRRADLIDEHLSTWFASRTTEEATKELVAHGVPAAVVVHPSKNLNMQQLCVRGFFENVHHPVHGDSVHPTIPFRLPMHDRPSLHRLHPPLLGEHNAAVLLELGFSQSEVESLRTAGVIGDTPVLK